MNSEPSFQVQVEHVQDYEFRVRFDWEGVAELAVDEPRPLGQQRGPNASRVLAAAVANCLSASLLFCLRKSHLQPAGMKATVTGAMARSEHGRLRVGGLDVRIDVSGLDRAGRLGRCTDLFEDFCVVTESVRQGIPVAVTVRADGEDIYHNDGEAP
ncbi:MAG: OsmC family protein [Gammaproteobacteria bacterium]